MIKELKSLYEEQARVERYNVATKLFNCKMAEGASVRAHVQKMIGMIEQLGKLSTTPMDLDYATDLILYSLPASFSIFIMNYNMAGVIKPLSELHSMLSTAEGSIRRAPEVLAVNKAGKLVKKGKGKSRKKGKKKGKTPAVSKSTPKPAKVSIATADTVCFHCNGKGHFKRDCQKFLAEQKTAGAAATSGIHVIDMLILPVYRISFDIVIEIVCKSHIPL